MKNQIEILGSKNQIIAVLRVKQPVMKVTKKATKKSDIIEHLDIRSKWEIGKEISHNFNAEINKSEGSIRIYGFYGKYNKDGNVAFDRTFKIGDTVEYDAYNYNYLNPILSIGNKTVTVQGHGSPKRMNLAEFIRRNWDLDVEYLVERNFETSMYI